MRQHRQQSLQQYEETSNGTFQQPRLTASALARMQQFQQQNSESSITPSSTTRSLYDVKAMQKEAVLSYVKVIWIQWPDSALLLY